MSRKGKKLGKNASKRGATKARVTGAGNAGVGQNQDRSRTKKLAETLVRPTRKKVVQNRVKDLIGQVDRDKPPKDKPWQPGKPTTDQEKPPEKPWDQDKPDKPSGVDKPGKPGGEDKPGEEDKPNQEQKPNTEPGKFDKFDFLGESPSTEIISAGLETLLKKYDLPEEGQLDFLAGGTLGIIREMHPGRLPKEPLIPGAKGANLPLSEANLVLFLRQAAVEICQGQGELVWDDGLNELLVLPSKLEAKITSGAVLISLPVACDQTTATMTMPFATGTDEMVAGLVVAAPDRPLGDALIARIWGTSLITLAHNAFLSVVASFAAASGRDEANESLVPRALSTREGRLTIQTQARHRFHGAPK